MDVSKEIYILEVITIMTGATFLCRSLPFFTLKRFGAHPALIYLGRQMPPMIMMILVLYSLTDVDFKALPYGLNELVATGVTVLFHLLFRNALLSIGLGTATFMTLKQTDFLSQFVFFSL